MHRHRSPRLTALATLAALCLAGEAAADLTLAPLFTDHMVLQRETRATVWGTAEPGEAVTVETSWDGAWTITSAGADGRWTTHMTTPAAGGPHRVTVRCDSGDTIVLEDVLIGEVWICSGQSNMEWPMTAIDGSEFELETANLPDIRLFDVAHQISMEPLENCEGSWRACSRETASSFSAVGFLFGRELHAQLDVPIGLIGTNWGGTLAEAWTSAGTLRAELPEFGPMLDEIEGALASRTSTPSLTDLQADWWSKLEREEPGANGRWMEASFAAGDWSEAELPGTWSTLELGGFDGCVWYRREIELGEDFQGTDLVLELGPIDDMDLTWFNGELVGATRGPGSHATPRLYTIPAGAVRAGTNAIVICAVDTGGVGRVGAAPEGMRISAAGAEEASLALAGTWRYRAGASLADLGAFPRRSWFHQNWPTALSNGMLQPLIPYAIRGAIWYQGESNRPRAVQYRRLFPAMITDWRERFGQGDFPFYYVQIAPFAYGGDTGEAAELREAQQLAEVLPNTGMAVTMDIGVPEDIHPRNKQDVANRLALLALRRTYGFEELVDSGPVYTEMQAEGASIRLSFAHAAGLSADGEELTAFTIAGSDRVFHPARATIDGETVVVSSQAVAEPVAVRFAWGAADASRLWNAAGLPASSFRTDAWPAVSASE